MTMKNGCVSIRLVAVLAAMILVAIPLDFGDASVATPGPPDTIVSRLTPATALTLAREPVLSVGGAQAIGKQILYEVTGAARLSDGSVVVAVSGEHEIRRFGPGGQHLWTAGQEGEGPGEFRRVRLLRACTTEDRILAYDAGMGRVSVFDGSGALKTDYRLTFQGSRAYTITCTPDAVMVVTSWGERRSDALGPFRWKVALGYADQGSSRVRVLREDMPGQDRVQYPRSNGPRTWGRRTVVGAVAAGVWLGTGDDYELQLVGWDGSSIRKLRWAGRDLAVTEDDIRSYRESLVARVGGSDDPNAMPTFERWWERERNTLPARFPAYSRILALSGGGLWIRDYPRPGEPHRWWFFGADGEWSRTLHLPPRTSLLDAGEMWAVVRQTDALGVESVSVYDLIDAATSGE